MALFFCCKCVCVRARGRKGEREMIGNGLLVFGRLCEHIMLFLTSTTMDRAREMNERASHI